MKPLAGHSTRYTVTNIQELSDEQTDLLGQSAARPLDVTIHSITSFCGDVCNLSDTEALRVKTWLHTYIGDGTNAVHERQQGWDELSSGLTTHHRSALTSTSHENFREPKGFQQGFDERWNQLQDVFKANRQCLAEQHPVLLSLWLGLRSSGTHPGGNLSHLLQDASHYSDRVFQVPGHDDEEAYHRCNDIQECPHYGLKFGRKQLYGY